MLTIHSLAILSYTMIIITHSTRLAINRHMVTEWNWLNDADTQLLQLGAGLRRRTREAAHRCAHCGKVYCQKQHLRRHQRYECGQEPMFQCPFCPKRCRQKIHVQCHIQRKHDQNSESTLIL